MQKNANKKKKELLTPYKSTDEKTVSANKVFGEIPVPAENGQSDI